MFSLTLGCLSIFSFGIFGGFDLSDEGNYYQSFAYPETVPDRQTTYYLFGHLVWRLLGGNLILMRIAVVAATVGTTYFLATGFFRLLESGVRKPQSIRRLRPWAVAAAIATSFLGYTISPPALSYNFQNSACLLAATGFLFRTLAAPEGSRWASWTVAGNLGGFAVLIGIDFFVKFSSSIPLAVIGLGLFVFASQIPLRDRLILLTIGLAGVSVVAGLFFATMMDFASWRAGISGTLGALTGGTFLGQRLSEYQGDLAVLGSLLVREYAPVWVVVIPAVPLILALRRWPKPQRVVTAIAGLWWAGHLIWTIDYFSIHRRFGVDFYGVVLVSLACGWVASLRTRLPKAPARADPRLAGAIGLLLVLPYLGAFGTDNNINGNALYQLAPWTLVAAWLAWRLDENYGGRWTAALVLTGWSTIAGLQFHEGFWNQPYRVTGNRSEQTIPTSIGEPATSVRLSPTAHHFIIQSRAALDANGYVPGDDLLVFFDLPGWVFAMGGVSPGHPWYYGGNESTDELNLMRLRSVPPDRLKRAFIVRHGNWDHFVPGLATLGLDFPSGYERITPEMLAPFTRQPFEIWAPKARTLR
jgi:hypothetical protein